jgi:putative copper resistance protein D
VNEAGLVASRFLHFATVMALFGLALFPLYTKPSRAGGPSARLSRWLRVMLRLAALLALLSGIAWGVFTVANMTGGLTAAADRDALWSIVKETGFGQVWLARLALTIALLALMTGHMGPERHPDWITPLVCAVLLVSLAGVGHTQASEGTTRVIHMSADAAHLLAAGAWLGGLLALGYLVTSARRGHSPEHTADARTALVRFSGMGYIAVAVLVGSGLINAWFLVGSVTKLPTTPYGQLLLVKLCLFAGMLVLASANRFWLIPSLLRQKKDGEPAASVGKLHQHVLGEQVLGLLIVLTVSFLGTMAPA